MRVSVMIVCVCVCVCVYTYEWTGVVVFAKHLFLLCPNDLVASMTFPPYSILMQTSRLIWRIGITVDTTVLNVQYSAVQYSAGHSVE